MKYSNGKSKLTLLIDGNWLLMSRLAAIGLRFRDIDDIIYNVQLVMTQSIIKLINEFKDIDNVIFCADGGSWRNDIEVPQFIKEEHKDESVEYKGNRIKSEDFDWDKFFEGYNTYLSKLIQIGVTTCQETGIEGDDWISYWSNKLYEDNTSVIIWSTDNDLKQLLKYNDDTGTFICTYNVKKGFTFIKDANKLVDSSADDALKFLFNSYYEVNSNIIASIISKSKKDGNFIDPKEIIIGKILNGDAGDNIFPIVYKDSGSKRYKIRKKDLLDINADLYDDSIIETYFSNLINSDFFKDNVHKTLTDIMEHFKLNRKLVLLNDNERPDYIKDILNKYDSYNKINNLSELLNILRSEENNLVNILNSI